MAYTENERSARRNEYMGSDRNRGDVRMDRDRNDGRDDRGFIDRAEDEVRSWFGDDRAERRREMDERYDERSEGRYADAGNHRPYTGARGKLTRENRSGNYDREDMYDYDRGYTQNRFGAAQTQKEYTNQDRDGRQESRSRNSRDDSHDREYSEWRNRQIDELDRDYGEWRQENARRFEDEFGQWRSRRQSQRSMLKDIPAKAELVATDGVSLGQIDKVKGDRIFLSEDAESKKCHSITCRHLDRVENNQVMIDMDSEQTRKMWRDESDHDERMDNMRGQREASNRS